ncbi:MAG: LysM peptidoglycan-binding domain-containing protein [Desulfobacteraceae bacterium]|nr:LysM peptidoglycan-binding domain-containing protein [Desulfobacteraceae bacterium]MCB9495061.1 LysM peptidoglycan-binding domain-containing protein [Desulfobacteraceae bacterium]
MDNNGGFDPKIERNYYDEELTENINIKSLKGEGNMKSFFKRADFPFFLLGGFVLILLVFILVKLPDGTREKISDNSLGAASAKELKQALDDIRNEIVEIRYNLSSGSTSKEDLSVLLNQLDKRFEDKFALIEKKVDDLKMSFEKNSQKNESSISNEKKSRDKKPLLEKKAELTSDPATVKNVYHTVKKGDTLYSISKKYGVGVDEIKKLNNMKNNSIQPGGKLIIKN